MHETSSQTLPRDGSRALRRIWRPARICLLIYLGLCIVFYLLQDWMLFPGRSTQGHRASVIRQSPRGEYELLHLNTRGGEKIVALFGRAMDEDGRPRTDSASRPTILFFYGNGMCLADTFGEFIRFRRMGYNVFIPEYVGYGMSSGKPSETALYQTADAAYEHLLTRTDVDANRIIAAGWSLGAAVAIDTAHRRPVIGLATFSAFTSLHDIAHKLFPWLPTSLLVRYKLANVDKIADVTCPILIAHGERDEVVPPAMSDRLQRAAIRSPHVERLRVETDHNEIFEAQDALFVPFRRFLESLTPPPAK